MSAAAAEIPELIRGAAPRAVFRPGALDDLGALAVEFAARRVLLVTDPGIVAAGHAERAAASLRTAGLHVALFDGVRENPTEDHVDAGVAAARAAQSDFLVGLGGGSSMDAAKGINFILTNGGRMADYWGINKAAGPMLAMIAVPTTAGTGSEAQSFALIADRVTHQKMACGDDKAMCRAAILDPELIASVPPRVAAAAGIDAIAHAVETAGCNQRTQRSRELSVEAWLRLDGAFETYLRDRSDAAARRDMLLGAHLAGAAIQASMLGAAHACANPLTSEFGVTHGVAVGLMLPHVVRFNAARGDNPYADLEHDAERLAQRVESGLRAAALPTRLSELEVPESALRKLAVLAAQQWTARFNPRPVGEMELLSIYAAAA